MFTTYIVGAILTFIVGSVKAASEEDVSMVFMALVVSTLWPAALLFALSYAAAILPYSIARWFIKRPKTEILSASIDQELDRHLAETRQLLDE